MTSAQPVSHTPRTTTDHAALAVATTPAAPTGPSMQSAKANTADATAPRAWNSAYQQELAAIEQLVGAAKPDHQAIARAANAFVKKHGVAQYAATIVLTSGAFLPNKVGGMTSAGAHVPYAADGIVEGHGDPVRYHERLAKLVPRVEAGEMTAAEARRKAAQPVLAKLGAIFNTHPVTQSEFANLHDRCGVVMDSRANGAIAFTTQSTFAPGYYDLSKRSWKDLESAAVLDGKEGLSVDPFAPRAGYDSLLRGLRYIGDMARYMAWETAR